MSGKNSSILLRMPMWIFFLLLAGTCLPHNALSGKAESGGLTVAAFRTSPGNPIRPLGNGEENFVPGESQAPLEEEERDPGREQRPAFFPEEEETPAQPLAPALSIPLQEVNLRFFSTHKPAWTQEFAPKYREAKFSLDRAVNLRMVERFTGPLNKDRRKFLQENRFLLIPQEECKTSGLDMLELFTAIGKERFYLDSTISNALFVGPDPFLHALHGYFSTRLQYLEQTRLSLSLKEMLEGLYSNAAALRKISGPAGAASFERLQAQILVPLAMLISAVPDGSGVTEYQQRQLWAGREREGKPLPASLEDTLEIAARYQQDFSQDNAAAIARELAAVFSAASAPVPSPLFSHHYPDLGEGHDPERPRGPATVDYSRFMPRSHYEEPAVLRAYFRSIVWLGEMGWNLSSPEGAADALNFALIMSMTPEEAREHGGQLRAPCENWREIMELTGFFVGHPSEAGYAEWVPYLLQTAGVESFTQHTASDPHVIARIQADIAALKPASPFFALMQRPREQNILRIFPARFSVPGMLAEELTQKRDPERENLPFLFSSLWVPAVMGSPYALEMLEPQVAASMQERLGPKTHPSFAGESASSLSPEGAAQPPVPAIENSGGVSAEEASGPGREQDAELEKGVSAMRMGLQRLSLLFKEEKPESWDSSLNTAWLHLLHTLTSDHGKGMPLYMQSLPFRAKQLETFLGSYAEQRGDVLAHEDLNFTTEEGGTAGMRGPRAGIYHPIPHGFVEPNLPFWHGMIRMAENMEETFAAYGLLEPDRKEGGALWSFKRQLHLCASLAEKELRGQSLSRKDYDSLREQIRLLPLVRPVPGAAGRSRDKGSEAIGTVSGTGTHIVYGATGSPYVMLVLVGNEQAPRLVVGVAYNHTEFTVPRDQGLSVVMWRAWLRDAREKTGLMPSPPPKPFWYGSLKPGR